MHKKDIIYPQQIQVLMYIYMSIHKDEHIHSIYMHALINIRVLPRISLRHSAHNKYGGYIICSIDTVI